MINELLSALGTAGNVIDAPGSVVRGLLSGNTDRAFGGVFDPSQRVSGRGMLENWGLLDQKPEGEGFGLGDLAGIGADMATNPLTYLPGVGLGLRGLRGAGAAAGAGEAAAASAAAGEAATPISGLLNARRGFAMAKDVVPGKITDRIIGGGVAEQANAGSMAKVLKDRAIEQLRDPSKGLTQAIYEPAMDAGAVLKTADPSAMRHEIIHGLTSQAYKTGEMQGLPFPVKMAAKIMRMGGDQQNFVGGLGYAADELAAHALENRGLVNQLKGAGQFLFSPGVNHDFYAREFGNLSPLVGRLYGGLPNVPRYAGYAGIGAGGAGLAGGGLYASNLLNQQQPDF